MIESFLAEIKMQILIYPKVWHSVICEKYQV